MISRRGLLKRAGAVGVAATGAGLLTYKASGEVVHIKTIERDGLQTFTADEADTVDAIVARLIPTDTNGPGAAEANVLRYIDQALSGGLSIFRDDYTAGLAQLDAYCEATRGARFIHLSPTDQDAVLTKVQTNTATGFAGASTFFTLVRTHTVQGMFCDPYHGGNVDFVGWDLIGYPGVKIDHVLPAEQALDTAPVLQHRSGYDFEMFKRKLAMVHEEGSHDGH
jgi:gluconate 2-dehydrogenase gamma chain